VLVMDVVVIGGGPAGLIAAWRAAELEAHTTLVTRDAFDGMAATDDPVPVRVMAHAARLMRETRQVEQYGIRVGTPTLDYDALLQRVSEVVQQVQEHAFLRPNLERAGVVIHDQVGSARFVDTHTVECERGPRMPADRVILCTGGQSRRLPIPLRVDCHAQRRLGANVGPRVDAHPRGRRDGSATGLGFQRARREGPAVRAWTTHPAYRG